MLSWFFGFVIDRARNVFSLPDSVSKRVASFQSKFHLIDPPEVEAESAGRVCRKGSW